MAKKKILFMITKGSPFGGAQKYVHTLATELPRDCFEPTVLVGAGNDLRDRLQPHGIPVVTLEHMQRDIRLIGEFKTFHELVKIIRRVSPDILHLNSTKAGGIGAVAGRICGVKQIIYTVHGWPFHEDRGTLAKAIIWLLSLVTALLCHDVIVIARSEERSALAMPFVNKDKIRLIHNGIQPLDFVERTTAREFLAPGRDTNQDEHQLWIGTVAELHKNKNIGEAISALKDIPDKFIYIVIGEGEQRPALEEQIRSAGLTEKVFLAGQIGDAAVYLKAFDIFVLPSLKEGLPYALFEAGLAALACLSSRVGGIPEIIEDQASGVLVRPNADEIKIGLEFLIRHPEKRKLFGEAIRKTITEKFSLRQMLDSTLRIYATGSQRNRPIKSNS